MQIKVQKFEPDLEKVDNFTERVKNFPIIVVREKRNFFGYENLILVTAEYFDSKTKRWVEVDSWFETSEYEIPVVIGTCSEEEKDGVEIKIYPQHVIISIYENGNLIYEWVKDKKTGRNQFWQNDGKEIDEKTFKGKLVELLKKAGFPL
jgi:hypothetical protein